VVGDSVSIQLANEITCRMAWILLFVNCVTAIAIAVTCTAQGWYQAENNLQPGACTLIIEVYQSN